MDLLQALILGFVQGLTEFLPVSSSAHLRIVSELIGAGDAGSAFTAITQLGTETAVIVFFWRDIVRIIGAWARSLAGGVHRGNPDALMGWWIILGSIPIVVGGLLFEDVIDSGLRSLWVVSCALIFFGVLLGVADRVAVKSCPLERLGFRDAVLYGFAQALALIPGVSRSGGTITMGLFLGYRRDAAARYSFLLAIPAVVGSGGYKLVKSFGDRGSVDPLATFLATGVAFFVALLVIGFFMRYISKKSFMPFVVYRIVLGVAIMVLLGFGVLHPLAGAEALTL